MKAERGVELTVQVTTTSYGPLALKALRAAVVKVKRDDPMAPLTVLVPNNIAGIVARRFLARGLPDTGDGEGSSNGIAGIYFSTLPRLAEQLASPTLTAQGRRPATQPVTAATIRSRLDAGPGIFEPVAHHPSTSRALSQAMRALRDVDETTLTTLESGSSLVKDVVRLHRETTTELAQKWYDTTDILQTATTIVREKPSATGELGPVLLYLPQDLTRAETAFAQAIAELADLQVIAGITGNPRADQGVQTVLSALSPGFQCSTSSAEPYATRVLNASDSDDEVRCVVREVVQRLHGVPAVPAHRLAILYADRSPYARLLHEHLGAAGITTNGPGVRPVNERAVSRLLLGLLEAGRTGFRRADMLRPMGEVPLRDFAGERISLSRWERVSREAGVVAGKDWDTRLTTYVSKQESTIEAERQKDDPYESTLARAGRNRETAMAMRQFMIELQTRFATATEATTWSDIGSWARDLFHDLVPAARIGRMPSEEQYAAVAIVGTLGGLAALDGIDSAPTVQALEEVLALELESALPRVGRFSEGVLVAPVTHAIGLDLDVICLVGLSEDLFPGRLRDDSLLPERVRVLTDGQLPSTRERVEARHRSLLAAFASASQVVASFPRGDLRRHTNRLPSRWLLPTLRHLSNIPTLAATQWDRAKLDKKSGEWLGTSPSYAGSLEITEAPSTRQEWRIRAAWSGQKLEEPAIDAALAMQAARDSEGFSRFDGNLAGMTGLPDFAQGLRAVSPTALESYAICPHQYFVKRMLHVEPVEAPEEILEISAMDSGSLIHECFDELISECLGRGELPDYGAPWTDRQRQRLQEIAVSRAAVYEAEGRTGHPLLWSRARARIQAILDWMVNDDNDWRAAAKARVVGSELVFGMHGHPEVLVPVKGGIVHFRGSADKVDERLDGTLLVTDIKSGSIRTFKDLSETNPVADGKKLQLPVYAYAARARHGNDSTPVEAMYWFVGRDRKRVQVQLNDDVKKTYADTVGLLVRSMAGGVFPARAPDKPDFRQGWVQCGYCNPDALGHHDVRRRWEAMRFAPGLADYTALVEPDAMPDVAQEQGEEVSDR
jgi:RecB family exonuclease